MPARFADLSSDHLLIKSQWSSPRVWKCSSRWRPPGAACTFDGYGGQPGGVVPWHSHDNRPAMIYIVAGEVVEYASNCAVPIVHKAGDVAPEKKGTSHWWKNAGSAPAVLISVDLFPVGMRMDDHMM